MTNNQCEGYGLLALQRAMERTPGVVLTMSEQKSLMKEFSRQLSNVFDLKTEEEAEARGLALLK